ncbi:MAG: DUF5790 family protein [Halodesulfurarchaeum sp.]
MSQTTLDDDLFDEAAAEVRDDIEDNLTAARSALPDVESIWMVEADNTLGVLNALKSALDVESAESNLRDAKKWYTMGERAGAFEDADDLEREIEDIEAVIDRVEAAHDAVGDLTTTLPEIRSSLEEIKAESE